LIAKIVVRADDRVSCLSKAKCALDELVIDGVYTTAELHKKLVQNADVVNGDFNIHWLENNLEKL
jgi:acetyl-CoA carboxylase biotin carboxylase subunit